MNATTDMLRGELERLFELDDMKRLSGDLLGYDPEQVGGTGGKAAFARALVECCAREDGLEALADAMLLVSRDRAAQDAVRRVFALDPALEAGAVIGGYKIGKKLGEGALGAVYVGEDTRASNGRPTRAAIKVISAVYGRDRSAVRRYFTSLRALRNERLDGLANILEVGLLPDGRPWVASEFIEGQPLSTRLARVGPMHFNEARSILRGVLKVLAQLHARAMVHGDVRAENVFIVRSGEESEAKGILVDPGTDRLVLRGGVGAKVNGVLPVFGTAKAVDPELARGRGVTKQSDLYAAGVLMYEALCGRPPFTGETAIDVLAQHLTAIPEPPSKHAPRGWVSRELDAVVLQALAKAPRDRYRNVEELLQVLEGINKSGNRASKIPLDEAAFDGAVAALHTQPGDDAAAAALERSVEAAKAWTQALGIFEEVAAGVEDISSKKALLFRVARIQHAEVEDTNAAEATYKKILEIDPADPVARVGLEEIKRATGDAEGLVELLLERVEHETSRETRALILREIAHLYERQLDSVDNAFVAWLQALQETPSDERAAREIERLATTPERWTEVVTALTEAVASPRDSADVLKLYAWMGRWYAEHLKRPDIALKCFAHILKLQPSDEEASAATAALYRRSESWAELVALLEQRAQATANTARSRDIRAEAAEVVLRKLSDTAKATAMFREILASDPGHPKAVEALADVYAETGRWRDLAELLEARSHAERGSRRVATLYEIGSIYEERLRNAERAEIHYQGALTHDPQHLPSAKGLERLFAASGRHKELQANLETQLTLAATPRQKVALLERVGALLDQEFLDKEGATAAFEKIVELEPSHESACAALEKLYRVTHRYEDLARILEQRARLAAEPSQRIALLLDAAGVLGSDVGALDRAVVVCDAVLAIDHNNTKALQLKAQIKSKLGDASAELDALERLVEGETDATKRSDLLARAGKLLLDKGAKDHAVDRYKRALDANPRNATAASALRAIFSSQGDAHGAVDLLEREIDVTEGASAKAKLLAEMGDLLVHRLHDRTRAAASFRQALECDPVCTAAARGLGDLAFEDKRWADVARYYEPVLARTGDMPPAEAKTLCMRCGDALLTIGEFARAQRGYLNAKSIDPTDQEVLERVADVTFESGSADEAAELYRDIRTRFNDRLAGAEKARVCYRLGESLRRTGDLEHALPILNEAAELMPEDPQPLAAMRKIHEATGKWDLLVRVLRRRIEHAEDDERFQLLMEAGDIFMQKLAERDKAQKCYVAALELRANDRKLLSRLMAVYSESKNWSRLVEVILRIADLVDDPKQQAKYWVTVASIHHHEQGNFEEAARFYERALDRDSSSAAAFGELVDCLTHQRNYEGLATAYRSQLRRLADIAASETRCRLWDELADVLLTHLRRPAESAEALEEAEKLDPEDRARTERLAAIYDGDPKANFRKAVRMHRALLEKSPYRAESYHALRQLYQDVGLTDEAWCVAQALTVLDLADPDETALYKEHRSSKPATAQEFLSEDLWFTHVIHRDQDPLLTSLFATIAPAVIATKAQPLESFGLTEASRRQGETDPAAMARTLHYAAGVAQIPLPRLYARESDPGGLSTLFADPPAIGLGRGALAGGPSQALAFVAARHLAYFRPGMFLRLLVPTGSGLRAWLLAAIRAATPRFPVPADSEATIAEHMATLKARLEAPQSEHLSSLVKRLLSAAPELDMKKWIGGVDLTADRVGFLLSNSLDIATAVVRASPEDAAAPSQKDRLQALHLYAVSEEYLELRRKLGIAFSE